MDWLRKEWSENYISDRYTKIAQQMFQVMMSKFATDKSRFERPSSVQEINGELYVKGAKKDAIKQIKVDAPSGLNVTFDGASTVTLNWSHQQKLMHMQPAIKQLTVQVVAYQ